MLTESCAQVIELFSTMRGSGWPPLKRRYNRFVLVTLSLGHALSRTVLNGGLGLTLGPI
ncbi:MAG TPA: hypothetical protein VLA93_05470 [Pyrinomonadaceae bacterium]|nr:hypothetical protein [Pyrinomonadaceae bacterium]